MRWQDDEASVVHVDESGEDEVLRLLTRPAGGRRAALVAVGQRRLVAVMSVGDV